MGMDGLRGSEVIRKAGGNVLVQDEATSIVWGMPGSIANSGLADAVLPIGDLAPEVLRRLRRVRPGVPVPAGSERRTA
jgi:two-component system chemotaxis response regulator CheB